MTEDRNLEQERRSVGRAENSLVGNAISREREDTDCLREEVGRLRAALEDIVALAHTSSEARQRLVQMERRAIAALSGADRQ